MMNKFPSIPRFFRDIVITEKIDGTNAGITIADDLSYVTAQSRNRILTLDDDNFGFARWVKEHEEELKNLGPGTHFGEWYGAGIQRGYGLEQKRFALFNVHRWNYSNIPHCCQVVPILYEGSFDYHKIADVAMFLEHRGSQLVPNYMNPEGIVIYHKAAKQLFKYTFDGDGHKGAR